LGMLSVLLMLMYLGVLNMTALSLIYLGDSIVLVVSPVLSAFQVPTVGEPMLPYPLPSFVDS
jgi:hypothetical protein